jgi:hypothetical protein
MRARRGVFVVVVSVFALVGVSAIASPDESSFSYGTIRSSCAPTDAPAIAITLTAERSECKRITGPYATFAIWRGLPIHAGQVIELGGGSNAGSAARCAKEGECKLAQSATIVFDSYEQRSGAKGHYEMNFRDGEILKGAFEVKWCEERVICG